MPYKLDINIFAGNMLFNKITKYFRTKSKLEEYIKNYKSNISGVKLKYEIHHFNFEK